MPSVKSIMTDILTLRNDEQMKLFDLIREAITLTSMSKSIHEDCREQRFSKGVLPPLV